MKTDLYTAKIVKTPTWNNVRRRPVPVPIDGLAVGDSVLVMIAYGERGGACNVLTDGGETAIIGTDCVRRIEPGDVGDLRATVWNAVMKDVIDTADACELYGERIATVKALSERGKRCSVCEKWLPVSQFSPNDTTHNSRRPRHYSACRSCYAARKKAGRKAASAV